eukprot:7126510-Alexandrium_andersonii.AAC.1
MGATSHACSVDLSWTAGPRTQQLAPSKLCQAQMETPDAAMASPPRTKPPDGPMELDVARVADLSLIHI